MKTKIWIIILLTLAVFATSCKTKEVPGRVRAPRRCNSCTKWSYTPQETMEDEALYADENRRA